MDTSATSAYQHSSSVTVPPLDNAIAPLSNSYYSKHVVHTIDDLLHKSNACMMYVTRCDHCDGVSIELWVKALPPQSIHSHSARSEREIVQIQRQRLHEYWIYVCGVSVYCNIHADRHSTQLHRNTCCRAPFIFPYLICFFFFATLFFPLSVGCRCFVNTSIATHRAHCLMLRCFAE